MYTQEVVPYAVDISASVFSPRPCGVVRLFGVVKLCGMVRLWSGEAV